MKILVIGATGNVGSEVVRQLVEAKVPVRALLRAGGQRAAPPGAEVAVGDLAQPETLDAAMEGVSAVFLLTPSGQVELERNAVIAAKRAGVERLVKLSTMSCDSTLALGRRHLESEREIRASGVPFTFLRPNAFMQNLPASQGSVAESGVLVGCFRAGEISLVDVRDVAAVAVRALTEAGHEGQTYVLTGPEALSYGELAARLTRALGKEITYKDVPPAVVRQSMIASGKPAALVGDLIELFESFAQGRAAAVTSTVAELLGRPPRTFDAFATEMAERVRKVEPVTPDRLLALTNGFKASALLAAGATHQLFTHIERGARTVEQIAARAGISVRGAQALLDGLTALGVVERNRGEYTNAEDTSQFLVDDKPSSMSSLARMSLHTMLDFANLADVAKTGRRPQSETFESVDDPFWVELVPALASLAYPTAKQIAQLAGVSEARRPSILDVGGGSGIYTLVCLGENPEATGAQIDWPSVNRVARGLAEKLGVAERFRTIDGDYHTTSFGEAEHDLVIYAHVAHLESPRDNVAILTRIRRALRPGGALVISDFILDEERRGKPFAAIFHTNMLLHTSEGGVWRRPDYRAWLEEAGFTAVSFIDTASPATLVLAR